MFCLPAQLESQSPATKVDPNYNYLRSDWHSLSGTNPLAQQPPICYIPLPESSTKPLFAPLVPQPYVPQPRALPHTYFLEHMRENDTGVVTVAGRSGFVLYSMASRCVLQCFHVLGLEHVWKQAVSAGGRSFVPSGGGRRGQGASGGKHRGVRGSGSRGMKWGWPRRVYRCLWTLVVIHRSLCWPLTTPPTLCANQARFLLKPKPSRAHRLSNQVLDFIAWFSF